MGEHWQKYSKNKTRAQKKNSPDAAAAFLL